LVYEGATVAETIGDDRIHIEKEKTILMLAGMMIQMRPGYEDKKSRESETRWRMVKQYTVASALWCA
jgi:hypothetical protein